MNIFNTIECLKLSSTFFLSVIFISIVGLACSDCTCKRALCRHANSKITKMPSKRNKKISLAVESNVLDCYLIVIVFPNR